MDRTAYFLPAEWHPQRCVQLTWPDATTDWQPYLAAITATVVQLVAIITRYEAVVIAAQQPAAARAALEASLSSSQRCRVTIVRCDLDDTWARDYGAITLLAADGAALLLDFHFNGWGQKFPSARDNRLTRSLHAQGALVGQWEDNNDFVLEGGSIETDGRGTLFTTTRCLLAPRRNEPLTQEEIEEQLRRRLNVARVVWLHHGQLIGDDTDGHIDTLVRVCPNDTLLYIAPREDDAQASELRALERELRALTTAAGTPYTLLALPLPDAIYYAGERLPATYANFLVINGAVIVPTYQQPAHDQRACTVIQRAFPDREIIPLDATTIIRQHGSIHCLTMQYPAFVPARAEELAPSAECRRKSSVATLT